MTVGKLSPARPHAATATAATSAAAGTGRRGTRRGDARGTVLLRPVRPGFRDGPGRGDDAGAAPGPSTVTSGAAALAVSEPGLRLRAVGPARRLSRSPNGDPVATDLQQELQASLGTEYTVERELGGGGMSRVFVAEERRLGRRVVVKVLSPELGSGLSADRFEREIRLSAQLQDARIVPLLRAGRVQDLPYYTMPYVEGESLRERLRRARVPLDEALRILRDLALALEYAHARQVVHRDIKPENVLLSGRTAVVADFGIAKAITAATLDGSAGTLTGRGVVVGTAGYMAPEQAAGDPVDQRADLYAWGVIAYETLSGVHPFADLATAQALMAAHIADAPVPLARRRPELPAALSALVDRCLAKDPAQRPADASVLVGALDAAEHPPERRRSRLAPAAAAAALALALAVAGGAWAYRRLRERDWARDEALPQADRLRAADRDLAAFQVLLRAERVLPRDTQIGAAIAAHTLAASITSSPPGASVAIQDYDAPDSGWFPLGTTPLKGVRIPHGYFRWRVAKRGVGELIVAPMTADTMVFALDSALAAPAGMVRVPENAWVDYIDFVGWVGPFTLPAFDIDRFEVTNRQYQAFVDAGGYRAARYWTQPFAAGGRVLTWAQAMTRLRDRTGRAGPATWEGGHYRAGTADEPVSGVSWFEASAYAAFAGRQLPTLAQWYEAAPPAVSRYVIRESNFSRAGLAPAGRFRGLGPFGTYDMAGNVREWAANGLTDGTRFILGGDESGQPYLYSAPEALSPFDRSPENGIRCVRNRAPLPPGATRSLAPHVRDFAAARPAGDAVFRAYQAMYAYDRAPLNARDEGLIQDAPDWRLEKVSFDAAYGNERVTAYLFLPKRVRPPYQTVVFFPSARVLLIPTSRTLGDSAFFDYVVQSGRAVMYPVYQDTYERRLLNTWPGQSETVNLMVQRSRDLERSLDYLATRSDIAMNEVAYLGVSMGSAEGVVFATLAQDRLKAIVFLDGGFFQNRAPPGTDQVDFAPRLRKPVLMVNGRYDFTFPVAAAQDPLFRMLGTPPGDKRHVILDTPHDVTADRPALVREVLGWLDRYLGRVE